MQDQDFTQILPGNAPPFDMVFVEKGQFVMGLENDPDAYGDEGPAHPVQVPSFFIGRFPVTQGLWLAVMGENPSRFPGENRPVENVSWEDITDRFLPKLNKLVQENFPGRQFRLPTEAEWEFAAKGGRHGEGFKHSGSDKLWQVGWFDENSEGQTHEVGLLAPNELGLFDMSGNVWEWVEDDWHEGYNAAPDDGRAWVDSPERGVNRVYRGGSYFNGRRSCRVSYRDHDAPAFRRGSLGFRLALSSQSVG